MTARSHSKAAKILKIYPFMRVHSLEMPSKEQVFLFPSEIFGREWLANKSYATVILLLRKSKEEIISLIVGFISASCSICAKSEL